MEITLRIFILTTLALSALPLFTPIQMGEMEGDSFDEIEPDRGLQE